jgi:hypothetical protein
VKRSLSEPPLGRSRPSDHLEAKPEGAGTG